MTATYKCNGQAIIFRFESIYQQPTTTTIRNTAVMSKRNEIKYDSKKKCDFAKKKILLTKTLCRFKIENRNVSPPPLSSLCRQTAN